MPTGMELISEERERQMVELGYDRNHDLQHTDEELAFAAACFAAPTTIFLVQYGNREAADPQGGARGTVAGHARWVEPWPQGFRRDAQGEEWTLDERLDELAKAGALIAAEMDRLQAEAGIDVDED